MKKEAKIIITILIVIIIALCIVIFKKKTININPTSENIVDKQEEPYVPSPITIKDEDILENNFTGTKSVIEGSSVLAQTAEKYIEDEILTFKQSADVDVPDMRAKFGSDSPTANYELDIQANHIKNEKTESIIIDEYVYTGGANGNNIYKVFTASLTNGHILALSDVIDSSHQQSFMDFLKKKLINWRPEGVEGTVVFKDEVNKLNFSDLSNWAYDDKGNLVIYFDKYEIGPGALGAIPFKVKLSEIKDFLIK